MRFWTKEEVAMTIDALKKHNGNCADASREVCKLMNRSFAAVYNNVLTGRKFRKYVVKRNTTVKSKSSNNVVAKPSGFTFEVIPTRIVLKEGHLQVYF